MSHPQQSIQAEAVSQPTSVAQKTLMTEEEARAVFRAKGITVANWARERGFSVELTRMVLAGKRKCLRGQSHEIAVAIGIKSGAA